jgi:(p)ppGpp synthase/HD superfamily hydrolase
VGGGKMSKLIKFAKEYALEKHGAQDHGCLKIDKHLADVAKHAAMHAKDSSVYECYYESIVAGAWLHDVVEDTKVTIDKLENDFHKAGFPLDEYHYVLQIVAACTDGPGKGRKDRHLNTYWKIRENPRALLVKLCDRRHNHERSIAHGEIYAAMYAKEFDYFKFALWRPRQLVALWAELDKQNKKLQEIVGW